MYSMVRLMKKIIIIIVLIITVISIGSLIAYNTIENNFKKLSIAKVESIDLSTLENGDYKGSYSSFPISVEVTVNVQDHRISAIVLNKHVNGQGQLAEEILVKVVEENSIEVDVVSGATYSSKVILSAISNALNNK